MCSKKELRKIEASGCNLSSEMEVKILASKERVEKIAKDTEQRLRHILL